MCKITHRFFSQVYDNPVFSSKLKHLAEGINLLTRFEFSNFAFLELGLKLHKAGKEGAAKFLYTPVVWIFC